MNQPTSISLSQHIHATQNVHHSHDESKSFLLSIVEKVSLVAVAAFAMMTDLGLFIPYFFVGTVFGAYAYFQEDDGHVHSSLGCSQGILEQMTGIKWPLLLSTAANIATLVCHIDHHSNVFVPLASFAFGSWCGKGAMTLCSLAYHHFTHELSNRG